MKSTHLRTAATIAAATLTVLAPAAPAAAAPSYLRVMNGPLWLGAHVRGTHHRTYLLVDLRDPVHPRVHWDPEDAKWNCWVDSNACGGRLATARGFVTRAQDKRYQQRFGVDDLCLYAPNDPYGAVWCADGRTYVTYTKWQAQA